MMRTVAIVLMACIAVSQGATLANTMVNASALLGGNTTFECQVDGTQNLGETLTFVKIYNTDQTLTISSDATVANATKHAIAGTYTLTVNDVVFDDEGEYRCLLGSVSSSTAYLTVAVAPTQAWLYWAGNSTSTEEGVTTNLTCEADLSRPPATFRWFRGNTEVTTNSVNPTVSVNSNGYGSGISHLELTPLEADAGTEYKCHVDVAGVTSVFTKTLSVAFSGSATIIASATLLLSAALVAATF